MCGIFGFFCNDSSKVNHSLVKDIINELFVLSESRGKESSGIAIKNYFDRKIHVLKRSIPASKLIKSNEYQNFYSQNIQPCFDGKNNYPISVIAHARLVTNGSQENNNNNQPVIKDHTVAVHNGIITNVDSLWDEYKTHINRMFEVDTEVFLALYQWFLFQSHYNILPSLKNTFNNIKGTVSTAILHDNLPFFIISTNNGSLYYAISKDSNMLLFASEEFILKSVIIKLNLDEKLNISHPHWLNPHSAIVINEVSGDISLCSLKGNDDLNFNTILDKEKFEIINHSPDKPVDLEAAKKIVYQLKISPLRKLLEYNIDSIKQLKRCTKCLLPETFPFIKFDEKGVCNYCHYYVVRNFGSRENEFREILKQYKTKDGKPDCLVPFSGGRDSSYGLHYIVNELNMRPITYTYDWGMVTDLARRNIARLCGKLGVENIIVSADIHKKRKYIHLNVKAWLKNPQLGLIPLFMAGDKQFFYYVNQVKKQTGIKLDIWCTNYLENTDFKVGFCGVRPTFDKNRPDYLPLSSKIKMAWYYLKNFIQNPAYINSSIFDTVFSFYAYYAEPRVHFYQLYDWVKWDENTINQTLIKEYDWELSPDTTSTWRIGDGTAAFYNYIYYTVAGFSEIETFRSNQIREGLITREEGLQKIYEENRPRFESLKWYLDTINIDFEQAITIINHIPKLYKLQ